MLITGLYRTFIVVTLAGGIIYLAQPIVMPIIFSAFIAMFCHPLVSWFEKKGIPFGWSIFMTVLGISLLLVSIIILFTAEGVQIAKNIPDSALEMGVESAFENPEETIEKSTDSPLQPYLRETENYISKAQEGILSLIPATLSSVKNLFVFLASCPIYIFFMLFSRRQFRKAYYNSFEDRKKIVGRRILIQINRALGEFLKGMGIVTIVIATLTTIGLSVLGIEHALFFGLLAGVLTLIPYLGVIISAIFPVVLALITKDSYWYAVGVVAVFAVVQFLEGNFITPKIMGNQVGLNPFAVILGIIIFGAVGGILGVLITIPSLAILKTVSFYSPGWKPLYYFLQV